MLPRATSISRMMREAMRRHAAASRIAINGPCGPVGYDALGERIDRFAGGVQAWRLPRGELVAILMPRGVQAVALFFGIMQAGACPCVLEPGIGVQEIRRRLRSVGACKLVAGEKQWPVVQALQDEMEVRAVGSLRDGAAARDSGDGGNGGDGGNSGDGDLVPTDRAMMQFTSGSTGDSKGVLLSHDNLVANARGVLAHTGVTPDDRLLHVMPLHHTNGINNQLIVPFIAGATVILAERFRAEEVPGQIARFGATYMTGVPTMYSRILSHLEDRSQLASLRFLRCGSAPITVALHEQVEAAFGVPLLVSYGLSEATCTSTMNPPGARRIGSVGTVLAGQQVRLFKAGTQDEVPPGSDGEICIAGPCLMQGYLGQDTDAPIQNGWLRSGDLGRFDPDGYLHVTGRIKDVIIRGGENISPQLVERVLERHLAVKTCCVIGGPHADLGEVPIAFVVLHEGRRVSGQDLQAHVAEHLSRVHVPAAIRFEDSLPENSVGKLDRNALRQRV